jgi:hypothetical protein
MARAARGRVVTRVLLDYSITLQIADLDRPTVEFKLEGPFDDTAIDGTTLAVQPEDLGVRAVEVAALRGAVVGEINVSPAGVLTLAFEDGRRIEAAPDSGLETWSFVSDDGGRVICMPGGQIAIWDAVT